MGKIFYVMGKSASGKDTVFKRLLERKIIDFQTVCPYTTRPIRAGEVDGVEYFFTDEETLKKFKEENKLVEVRTYPTIHGDWSYFTVDDGQIDLNKEKVSYLMIGTLESYEKMQKYYGADMLIPIYLEVEDGIRLKRALEREEQQKEPKYKELCRRYLADEKDFMEKNMKRCNIRKRYNNTNIEDCILEIEKDIRNNNNFML